MWLVEVRKVARASLSSSPQCYRQTAGQTWRGRLSFSGSVPEIWSDRPVPLTTTPHLCSVAYLTLMRYSGKLGSLRPAGGTLVLQG